MAPGYQVERMIYLFFFSFFSLDLEQFLHDGLKGENLSKKAKDKKEAYIRRIKDIKLRYFLMLLLKMSLYFLNFKRCKHSHCLSNSFPHEFKDKGECCSFFMSIYVLYVLSYTSGPQPGGLDLTLNIRYMGSMYYSLWSGPTQ